jgi:YidC/Oxa1 family membrane protein insertase
LPEIKNPNLQTQGPGGGSGGGDTRSTIVFFALMLAVLVGYQFLFKPASSPAPQSAPQPAQTQSQSSQPAVQTSTGSAPAVTAASSGTPAVAASAESETTVENDLYKIVFTNRGGRVKQWILKNYQDSAGKPLDLVQSQIAAQFGYPLSLFTYEPELTNQVNSALYQISVSGGQPSATGLVVAPGAITYHYAANGLDVTKTFSFDSTYVVDVETQVKRNGAPVRALVQWPAGLGDMEEFLPSSATRSEIWTSTASEFAWSSNGKQDSLAAKKVSGGATLEQPYSYAAVMDLYFAAAFLPYNPQGASVVTLHHSVELPSKPDDPSSKTKPADGPQGHRRSRLSPRHRL